MPAENAIVAFWLESENYSIIQSLNAGKRVIDFIAFKNGRAYHIEVAASLHTRRISEDLQGIKARFEDTQVVSKIKEKLKFYNIKEYQKMIVTNYRQDDKVDSVKIIDFDTVAMKVLKSLDRQNYEDTAKRTMQIVKFIIMKNPESVGKLLSLNMLGSRAKRKLMDALIEEKYIEQKADNAQIDTVLAQIAKRPDNGKIIADSVNKNLNVKAKKNFAAQLLKNSDSRKIMKKAVEKQLRINQF